MSEQIYNIHQKKHNRGQDTFFFSQTSRALLMTPLKVYVTEISNLGEQ